MQTKKNIFILTITLVILFLFFIGLTNTLINSYVNDPGIFKERHEDIAIIPAEPAKPILQKHKDVLLISEDPAKYSIQVLTDNDLSLSQTQWDVHVRTALLHSKTAELTAGDEKTPKELKEKLNRINRQIKDLEKTDQKSPDDQSAKMKLQSLYILKSSLTVLDEAAGEKAQRRK